MTKVTHYSHLCFFKCAVKMHCYIKLIFKVICNEMKGCATCARGCIHVSKYRNIHFFALIQTFLCIFLWHSTMKLKFDLFTSLLRHKRHTIAKWHNMQLFQLGSSFHLHFIWAFYDQFEISYKDITTWWRHLREIVYCGALPKQPLLCNYYCNI